MEAQGQHSVVWMWTYSCRPRHVVQQCRVQSGSRPGAAGASTCVRVVLPRAASSCAGSSGLQREHTITAAACCKQCRVCSSARVHVLASSRKQVYSCSWVVLVGVVVVRVELAVVFGVTRRVVGVSNAQLSWCGVYVTHSCSVPPSRVVLAAAGCCAARDSWATVVGVVVSSWVVACHATCRHLQAWGWWKV